MASKTIFGYCAILLIYPNLRENDGVDLFIYLFIYLFIFASQEAYPIVRQNNG